MSNIFSNPLKGRVAILLLIITNMVYGAMLLWSIPAVSEFADGMLILDMMPWGYDFEYATSLLQNLDMEGRSAYLYRQMPLDMVYPFLFGMCYSYLMAWMFSKIPALNANWTLLCLLPLIAGLFDYLENIGIIMILLAFDDLSQRVVNATSAFTIVKSISTTIYFISLIVLFAVLATRRIRSKMS